MNNQKSKIVEAVKDFIRKKKKPTKPAGRDRAIKYVPKTKPYEELF